MSVQRCAQHALQLTKMCHHFPLQSAGVHGAVRHCARGGGGGEPFGCCCNFPLLPLPLLSVLCNTALPACLLGNLILSAMLFLSSHQSSHQVCMEAYGIAPEVLVAGDLSARLPYLPSHLDYMLYELLKNSMRAGNSTARNRTGEVISVAVGCWLSPGLHAVRAAQKLHAHR